MKLAARIKKIISEIQRLELVCYPEHTFSIDFLTIFAQDELDFETLRQELAMQGIEYPANNGFKYELTKEFNYAGEKIKFIRIRKPDVHRKEYGCADLSYKESDYNSLREIAFEKGFDVILRKDYQMIELSDFAINVYAYIVHDD